MTGDTQIYSLSSRSALQTLSDTAMLVLQVVSRVREEVAVQLD